MKTLIDIRVAEAQAGINPAVICKMPSGWAVMGDVQFLPGYCLLLPDPVVGSLNALSLAQRGVYLHDMTIIGDALLEITGAYRINYEILGNSEPALHTHIIPRYDWEPEDRRKMPVWLYDWKSSRSFNPQEDKDLMQRIALAIQMRII